MILTATNGWFLSVFGGGGTKKFLIGFVQISTGGPGGIQWGLISRTSLPSALMAWSLVVNLQLQKAKLNQV